MTCAGIIGSGGGAPAPDAAILDAFADTGATTTGAAGSFTVSAGSNRMLICIMHFTSTDSITGLSWGGEAMIEVLSITSSGGGATTKMFRLMEAGIAAASGTGFAVTGSVGGRYRATAGSFENVDQTTPVIDTATQTGNLSSGTMSLDLEAGGLAVAGATTQNDTTYDWTGVTERVSTESDGTMSYSAASEETSTDPLTVDVDTPSGGASGSTSRQCALAVSYRKAA